MARALLCGVLTLSLLCGALTMPAPAAVAAAGQDVLGRQGAPAAVVVTDSTTASAGRARLVETQALQRVPQSMSGREVDAVRRPAAPPLAAASTPHRSYYPRRRGVAAARTAPGSDDSPH